MLTFLSIISHGATTSPLSTSYTSAFFASSTQPGETEYITNSNGKMTHTSTYGTTLYGVNIVDDGMGGTMLSTVATTTSIGSAYTDSLGSSTYFSGATSIEGIGYFTESSSTSTSFDTTPPTSPPVTGSFTYTTGFTTTRSTTRFYKTAHTSTVSTTAHTSTSTTSSDGNSHPTTRTTSVLRTSVTTDATFESITRSTMTTSTSTTAIISTDFVEFGTVFVCQNSETGFIVGESFGDLQSVGSSFTQTTVVSTSTGWISWTIGGSGVESTFQYTISSTSFSAFTSSQSTTTSRITYTSRHVAQVESSLPHSTQTTTIALPTTTQWTYSTSSFTVNSSSASKATSVSALSFPPISWVDGRGTLNPDSVNGLTTNSVLSLRLTSSFTQALFILPTTFSEVGTLAGHWNPGNYTHVSSAGSSVTTASRTIRRYNLRSYGVTTSNQVSIAMSTSPSRGYFLPTQLTTTIQTSTAAALSASPSENWHAFFSQDRNATSPVSYPLTTSRLAAGGGTTTSITLSIEADTMLASFAYTTTVAGGATTLSTTTSSAQLTPIGSMPVFLSTSSPKLFELGYAAPNSVLKYGVMPGVYRTAEGSSLSPTEAVSSATTLMHSTRVYIEPMRAFEAVSTDTDTVNISATTVQVASPYIPSSLS